MIVDSSAELKNLDCDSWATVARYVVALQICGMEVNQDNQVLIGFLCIVSIYHIIYEIYDIYIYILYTYI